MSNQAITPEHIATDCLKNVKIDEEKEALARFWAEARAFRSAWQARVDRLNHAAVEIDRSKVLTVSLRFFLPLLGNPVDAGMATERITRAVHDLLIQKLQHHDCSPDSGNRIPSRIAPGPEVKKAAAQLR